MGRGVITLRHLAREIGIAAVQTVAIGVGLLTVAALAFAMPIYLGLALKGLR